MPCAWPAGDWMSAQADQMVFEAATCRLELGAAILARSPEEALPLLVDAEQAISALGRKQEAARAAAALASAAAAAYDYATAEAALGRAHVWAEEVGGACLSGARTGNRLGFTAAALCRSGHGALCGLLTAVTRYLATENKEATAEPAQLRQPAAAGPRPAARAGGL